jgi:hypothetical protein
MPSKSVKQRNFILHLRSKYKNPKNTPEKYKWIWDDEWLVVDRSKAIVETTTRKKEFLKVQSVIKGLSVLYEVCVDFAKKYNRILIGKQVEIDIALKEALKYIPSKLSEKGFDYKFNYDGGFYCTPTSEKILDDYDIDSSVIRVYFLYCDTIEKNLNLKYPRGFKVNEVYKPLCDITNKNIDHFPVLYIFTDDLDNVVYVSPSIMLYKYVKNEVFKESTQISCTEILKEVLKYLSEKKIRIKEEFNEALLEIKDIGKDIKSILRDKIFIAKPELVEMSTLNGKLESVYQLILTEDKCLYVKVEEDLDGIIRNYKFYLS